MNKVNTSKNDNIEYRANGKFANAILTSTPTGDRIARLNFKNGKKLVLRADRINLLAMEAKDVSSALDKTCHVTGRIALYELTTHNGPKGVTRIYSSQNSRGEETGYGLFLKKGKKVLSFALSRLDTLAMNAKNLQDAARKAAFTGRIALKAEATAA